MENIRIGLVLLAGASLYVNYLLWKRLKSAEKQNEESSQVRYEERDLFFKSLNSREITIDNCEKEIKALRNSRDNLRNIISKTQKRFDNLESDYKKLVESNERLGREFDSLAISHKKIAETNEKLYSNFFEKEEELSILDMAYDELMKAYNSNAMDLYFWNLLPKADRETRRRFLKNGKYRVCNLNTGELVFEVV
ncbi:hypothetical protein [Cetobacterium sp. ZOR0034]|uniref:hypothetical protein n=1 Tax=Cetobacterium sp. ZOR0034 TaxID=1339239 RepID=UPI0006481D73|nr:hypothetical protein [Cetobacterium sp. ZOR0034]